MAINRPTTKTIISTNGWGIPITDEVNALRTEVNALKAIPTWINVTYINGWATNPGMQPVQYRKLMLDLVQIRGFVYNGTIGSAAFVLPSGYRPPMEVYTPGGSWSGSVWTASRAVIAANGNFTPTSGYNQYFCCDALFSITP